MYHQKAIAPFGQLVTARESGRFSLTDVPTSTLINWVETQKVLVLRGFRQLSQTDFEAFARSLGDLLKWEFGEVLNLRIKKDPANHLFSPGRVELHWDGAYISETPRFNMFQCLEASDEGVGGETLFSNTVKIWEDATEQERNLWSRTQLSYSTEKKAHYGGTIHISLVDHHPCTGEPVLRFIEPYNEDNASVNPVQCRVSGISEAEADNFILGMIERFYDDRYLYRHRWQRGDFVVVDNNAVLHGRARLRGNITRHLQRIHVL